MMSLREGAVLALNQVRSQKLKSFFALIGVLIGVMFLMTVVSVVEGLNRYMKEDFAQTVYGLNTLTLRRFPSINFESDEEVWREFQRRKRMRFEDADALRQRMSIPALIAVESGAGGRVKNVANGKEVENVWLTGASVDFFRIREFEVEKGRLFTAPEDRLGTNVVVLGAETADKLFPGLDPVGRTVRIENFPYTVIGVLKKQGSLLGMSLDRRAIAPAHSQIARSVNPHGVVDEILVRAENEQAMLAAQIEVEQIMRSRRNLRPGQPNTFVIETADDSMSFWTKISRILFIAFPGLVAIALVVGGMVIMNIMLVSVVERTREIGVRKALGARRRDIVVQVLIESATLSGMGAVIGIFLGVGLAMVVKAISPLPAAIAPVWMAVAAFMGVGVGVLAGIYPANRAARMDPVVALRAE
jgi:putative ABC transport system permease protein